MMISVFRLRLNKPQYDFLNLRGKLCCPSAPVKQKKKFNGVKIEQGTARFTGLTGFFALSAPVPPAP